MSLADELLADLGSDDENTVQEPQVENDVLMGELHDIQKADVDLSGLADKNSEVTSDDLVNSLSLKDVNIASMSRLRDELLPVLSEIGNLSSQADAAVDNHIENSPRYDLLVKANNYSVEIDNEIFVIHKVVREIYARRFDELGSLVPRPVEYAHCVKAIGNDLKGLAENKSLTGILPKGTLMVITMSAFENKGEPLSSDEFARVMHGCDMIIDLDSAKQRIISFVSSQLEVFAPNITAIVGSHAAAQLMGIAGGLQGLSQTIAANIPSLGARQPVGIGFGHTGARKEGYLYRSDIIQQVPPDKRKQAMRIVSGRLVLAARVDLLHGSKDGSQGMAWKTEIQARIEKLMEPPINKGPKALPVPVEKPSKKRGGKRIRKYKEQFQQTELQKAANRMAFGTKEEDVLAYDESVGLGMAGANSGSIKNIQISGKTRAKMSKGMLARVSSLNKAAQDTVSDGLQSSLNFAPNQGIQLIDPFKNKPKENGTDRWFSSGTFTQLANKKPANGEFVIPLSGSNLKRKSSTDGHDDEAKRPKPDSA